MVSLDNLYAERNGTLLTYDMFRPDSDEVLPLVLCIHGGGWISGEKENMHDVAAGLAAKGFAAASAQYRLAPLHPFPAAVEDLQDLVRLLRRNAAELKIDPNRLYALGTSAGGHLACMLGLTDPVAEDQPPSRVNAVVDFCGITDVTKPREKHFDISWSFLDQFMGNLPFEGNEAYYQAASPVYYVDENAPPFCVLHGEDDDIVPISQSADLVKKFQQEGRPIEFHRFAGEAHGFSAEIWPEVERIYTEFLQRCARS